MFKEYKNKLSESLGRFDDEDEIEDDIDSLSDNAIPTIPFKDLGIPGTHKIIQDIIFSRFNKNEYELPSYGIHESKVVAYRIFFNTGYYISLNVNNEKSNFMVFAGLCKDEPKQGYAYPQATVKELKMLNSPKEFVNFINYCKQLK